MANQRFPKGIEKIIALAAIDEKFRRSLLADREEALDNCIFELSPAERAIFRSISNRQLKANIKRVTVPKHARHLFLKGAIAAAIALIMGAGLFFQTTVVTLGCTVDVGEVERVEATDEEKVVNSLYWIVDAQSTYRQKHGTYAEALEDLLEKKEISPELAAGRYANYVFHLGNVSKDSFHVRAVPEKEGHPAFFIDETAIVRFSDTGEAGPESPPFEE